MLINQFNPNNELMTQATAKWERVLFRVYEALDPGIESYHKQNHFN